MRLPVKLGVKASGRYNIEVKRAGQTKSYKSDNLILNDFYNYVMTNYQSDATPYLVVGTGVTSPQRTDSALENETARYHGGYSNKGMESIDDNTQRLYQDWRFSFPKGAIVGNISELGVEQAGRLISRALIEDENGNPVTLTFDEKDQVTITWTLNLVIPKAWTEYYTVDIEGVSTEVEVFFNPAMAGSGSWIDNNSYSIFRKLYYPAFSYVYLLKGYDSLVSQVADLHEHILLSGNPYNSVEAGIYRSTAALGGEKIKSSFSSSVGAKSGALSQIEAIAFSSSPVFTNYDRKNFAFCQMAFNPPIVYGNTRAIDIGFDLIFSRAD